MATDSQLRTGAPDSREEPQGTRLESWKEIASHLKRDIRTVQRWEKREGLPVRRHLHDNRSTVYAFSAELEAWWLKRQPQLEPEVREPAHSAAAIPQSFRRMPARRVLAISLAGLLAAGALAGLWWWSIQTSRADPGPKITLAVLPFVNLSGDEDQEYFADGLTEEIIAELAGYSPQTLGVIARTSVMRYKGGTEDIIDIARELGVEYLLESSVRREGDKVRITAQLIRADDRTHVWAESYDREIGQILPLQRELAETIARELQVGLPAGSVPVPRAPADPEAHLLYLKGRYFWNKRTPDGLLAAVAFHEQALDREPTYAPAWAGLAIAYALFDEYHLMRADEAFPRVKSAARRALELDPKQVEARAALALVRHWYDWDYAGAEHEFREATAANPNSSVTRHWYGMFLMSQGRHEEARRQFQAALRIDPLSASIPVAIGASYYHERRFDNAIAHFQRVLTLQPRSAGLRFHLGRAYVKKGMMAEAVQQFETGVELSDGETGDASLAYGYAASGRREEALRLIRELRARGEGSPYYVAGVYAALGEKDLALRELEEGMNQRIGRMTFLKVEPMFDAIRDEPRFQELCRRIGLP